MLSIKRISKVTIRGSPWTVKWPEKIRDGTCFGLCEHDINVISFESALQGKKLLEIAIHEPLHAEFPKASEEAVTQAAKDIADALWRMGFRCGNTK